METKTRSAKSTWGGGFDSSSRTGLSLQQMQRLMFPNFFAPRAADVSQGGGPLQAFDPLLFDRETILYPPLSSRYSIRGRQQAENAEACWSLSSPSSLYFAPGAGKARGWHGPWQRVRVGGNYGVMDLQQRPYTDLTRKEIKAARAAAGAGQRQVAPAGRHGKEWGDEEEVSTSPFCTDGAFRSRGNNDEALFSRVSPVLAQPTSVLFKNRPLEPQPAAASFRFHHNWACPVYVDTLHNTSIPRLLTDSVSRASGAAVSAFDGYGGDNGDRTLKESRHLNRVDWPLGLRRHSDYQRPPPSDQPPQAPRSHRKWQLHHERQLQRKLGQQHGLQLQQCPPTWDPLCLKQHQPLRNARRTPSLKGILRATRRKHQLHEGQDSSRFDAVQGLRDMGNLPDYRPFSSAGGHISRSPEGLTLPYGGAVAAAAAGGKCQCYAK